MRSFKNGQNSGARRNRDEIYPAESKKMKIAESRCTQPEAPSVGNSDLPLIAAHVGLEQNDFNDDG